jgi:hypothetical protein
MSKSIVTHLRPGLLDGDVSPDSGSQSTTNVFYDPFYDPNEDGEGEYNPLFTITSVSGAEIQNSAGSVQQVYISGEDFPSNFRVEVPSNLRVMDSERLSSTTIVANIRYNGGLESGDELPITVIAGRYSFTLQQALVIVPSLPQALLVESITPTEIIANGNSYSCTISGIGFTPETVVAFSGEGVTFTRTGSTSGTITGTLVAAVGAAQTVRDLIVTRDVSATLSNALTILPPPVVLTITSVSPVSMPQGSTANYTVDGTGFNPGITASISGTGITINSVTRNSSSRLTINATVSPSATPGNRNLTVTNTNAAFVTRTNAFNVVAVNATTINQAWLDARGAGPYILDIEGATYTLAVDVTVAGTAFYVAKRNITLDLNGHTIYYNSSGTNGKWGICLYVSWINTEITIPGAQIPTGFTYRNGNIECVLPGNDCYGVYGHRGNSSLCSNMSILSKGRDSYAIFFRWVESPTTAQIYDSYFECQTSTTNNRHSGPACIKAGGQVIARRNVLLGGNSGFAVESNSIIQQNVIRHSGFDTNGYGGWFYRNSNVNFSDNIVIPSNGRGVLWNSGTNHVADNNVILHLEASNAEFGRNLNPPAIRSRYEASNCRFRGNTTLGIGGNVPGLTSASSMYLTNHDQTAPCEFSGNNCTTILTTASTTTTAYAQPLTMETHGRTFAGVIQGSQDIIDNNVMRSNLYFVRTAGYDGDANQRRPLIGNTFNYVDGDTARNDFVSALNSKLDSFESLFTATRFAQATTQVNNAITQISNLITGVPLNPSRSFWWAMYNTATRPIWASITNSTFGAGVNPQTISQSALREASVSLRVGSQLNYQLLDGLVPVANANVIATNDRGDQFELRSDASGWVSVPIIAYAMDKPVGINQPFSQVTRLSTTLEVIGNVASPWIIPH